MNLRVWRTYKTASRPRLPARPTGSPRTISPRAMRSRSGCDGEVHVGPKTGGRAGCMKALPGEPYRDLVDFYRRTLAHGRNMMR